MDNFDLRAFLSNNPLLEQDGVSSEVLKRRQVVNDYIQEFRDEQDGLPELLRKLGIADDVENYLNKFNITSGVDHSDFMTKASMKKFFIDNHEKVDSGKLVPGTTMQNYVKWWNDFAKGKSDAEQPVYTSEVIWDDWVNGEFSPNEFTTMTKIEFNDMMNATAIEREQNWSEREREFYRKEIDKIEDKLVDNLKETGENVTDYLRDNVAIVTGQGLDGAAVDRPYFMPEDAYKDLNVIEQIAYRAVEFAGDDPWLAAIAVVGSMILGRKIVKADSEDFKNRRSKDYKDMTENESSEEVIDPDFIKNIKTAIDNSKEVDQDELNFPDVSALTKAIEKIKNTPEDSPTMDSVLKSAVTVINKIPAFKDSGVASDLKAAVKDL